MLYDNIVMNLNANCYKDTDKDFAIACELSEKILSHEDMIGMLKKGNIQEKQLAALELDCVNNSEEWSILVKNLTGCDGKIREAVALKINQLLIGNPEAVIPYINPCLGSYPEIFADATIDINANICRLVIDSVSVLKKNKDFAKRYSERILYFINETFSEIDKFIYKDKKYTINKQLFKLYWCLESLKLFIDDIPPQTLLKILERASIESEYTIREKVAQILILTKWPLFNDLYNKLKNDKNYYVKVVFEK